MRFSQIFTRLGLTRAWSREVWFSGTALVIGFALMPALIFLAGTSLLGRYDGASLGGLYESIYRGLGTGSVASWIVLLGPYGLYLLFKALWLWWRAGTTAA
jgi:hypothetical protein